LAGAAAVAALSLLTACKTTYDASADTTTPAAQVTTTLPTGSAADLLPVMQQEVAALTQKVAAGKGDADAASRIEALWAAIQPEIEAGWPDQVEDFEFVVRLCRDAADRNRPANADRASKNLDALVTLVLG
jgi:hypothetical protein